MQEAKIYRSAGAVPLCQRRLATTDVPLGASDRRCAAQGLGRRDSAFALDTFAGDLASFAKFGHLARFWMFEAWPMTWCEHVVAIGKFDFLSCSRLGDLCNYRRWTYALCVPQSVEEHRYHVGAPRHRVESASVALDFYRRSRRF